MQFNKVIQGDMNVEDTCSVDTALSPGTHQYECRVVEFVFRWGSFVD